VEVGTAGAPTLEKTAGAATALEKTSCEQEEHCDLCEVRNVAVFFLEKLRRKIEASRPTPQHFGLGPFTSQNIFSSTHHIESFDACMEH
jgi:hypothetical protein